MAEGLLNVYKASAGSGKTFRLAVEYLKLLVDDPTAYRHILAVTFTNKATNEMKTRILSQLYGISHRLPDSESYMKKLLEETRCDEPTIRKRCRLALQLMLHDYGRFSVTTIDSFFQTILRQLIQELDLPSNLRVDLDSEGVLAEAVGQLMDDMTKDNELLNNVLAFVDSKMDIGHSWNVGKDLNDFGKNIFSEQYQEHGNKVRARLQDREAVTRYRQTLKAWQQAIMKDLADTAERFFSVCAEVGIDQGELSGAAPKMFDYFEKLRKGKELPEVGATVLKRAEDASAWLVKKKQAQWGDIVQARLVPLLAHAVEVLQSPDLPTLRVVGKNLHQLSLLDDIDKEVRGLNEAACRFLLVDTAQVLHRLIDGSDVPFIYERTGARIDHIMIDEMQDTSRMQWKNFKPLLLNSMAAGKKCLLVGDVKQSIYRWRNGDWGILNNLDKDPDFEGQISQIPGNTNYRSYGNVIDFNNGFFLRAADLLSQQLGPERGANVSLAYGKAGDHADGSEAPGQQCVEGKKGKGYVRVEQLHIEGDATARAAAEIERMWENVQALLAHGVAQSDIAILVRRNNFVPDIINYFQQQTEGQPVDIVSGDAFRLDASRAVRTLVQALRVAVRPDDPLQRAVLLHIMEAEVPAEAEAPQLPPALLPAADATPLPLRELCAELAKQLRLDQMPDQDAYLFSFFDHLSAYIADKGADIEQFVAYWDEKLHKETIPADKLQGVRILTIHKSKGLEFDSVIVPFCEWSLDADDRTLLWCEPQAKPYNEMPLLPVNYSTDAKKSYFSSEMDEEQMRSYVDNLNLLYVAFTRAAQNLMVISSGTKKQLTTGVCGIIGDVATQMVEDGHVRQSGTEELRVYEVGDDIFCKKGSKDSTENVLLQEAATDSIKFRYTDKRMNFIQSNDSVRFVLQQQGADGDHAEALAESELRDCYIDEGRVFHELMASIRTLDDAPLALRRVETMGVCPDPAERRRLAALLRKAFANPVGRDWFDARWTVVNEQDFIFVDSHGAVKKARPDRVITDGRETIVIDYKTGAPSLQHRDQVNGYVSRLRLMGHPQVSGFLWYVDDDRIVPCS